jgi:hypothetical protein
MMNEAVHKTQFYAIRFKGLTGGAQGEHDTGVVVVARGSGAVELRGSS